MKIERSIYLKKLIDRQHNGMIKVITGVRRCGKSYLVFNLFYDYLKSQGVDNDHIIMVNLESRRNIKLRNPDSLLDYIDSQVYFFSTFIGCSCSCFPYYYGKWL